MMQVRGTMANRSLQQLREDLVAVMQRMEATGLNRGTTVGVSGRSTIPVAPYACFGSLELAERVIETLDGGFACLMANHGQIAIGKCLRRVFAVALEVEEQSAIYWGSLAIGGSTLLSDEQMTEVFAKSKNYGVKS